MCLGLAFFVYGPELVFGITSEKSPRGWGYLIAVVLNWLGDQYRGFWRFAFFNVHV